MFTIVEDVSICVERSFSQTQYTHGWVTCGSNNNHVHSFDIQRPDHLSTVHSFTDNDHDI